MDVASRPRVVAFLPVKGTSQRVANKNLRSFNGEPFFLFTLRKLLRCALISEVFVDSESDAILQMAEDAGASTIKRPAAMASNSTDGNALMRYEVAQVDADIYVQCLCTSPFLRAETIDHTIQLLVDAPGRDSAVLIRREKVYAWKGDRPEYNIDPIPNSVDLPESVFEQMGLYVVRAEAVKRLGRRVGDSPVLTTAPVTELIDVNTEEDFRLAELVVAGMHMEEVNRLRLLAQFVSTPVLSDVCDELGVNAVLNCRYHCMDATAKLFGRARTLSLIRREPEDPQSAIYQALESYRTVISNDVLMVHTELPEFAYFGELNTSLAIRAGAVGAVIGGVTRDTVAVHSRGFPVFSKGSCCRDVKERGKVRSINRPIVMDGIPVAPNDLVLADHDGIAVIPKSWESKVIQKAIDVVAKEKSILGEVLENREPGLLVDRYGYF